MGEHNSGIKFSTRNKATLSAVVYGLFGVFACGAPIDGDTEVEAQWAALGLADEANGSQAVPFVGSTDAVPTDIDTLSELQNMSPTGNYRLTANIDASAGFTPIQFSGTFDGNNFTIQNVVINQPTSSMVGFFSALSHANIRNLRLLNVNVRGDDKVGGLAGSVFESVIADSFVEGTVTGGGTAAQGTDVGLFAGYVHGADIRRSYSRGTVAGLATKVGGFIGTATHSVTQGVVIKECYARVTVNPTTSNAAWTVLAGGFIGYASGIDVSDVYALGSVRGRGPVAGLIAQIDSTTDRPIQFYNSYSRNTVTDANGPDRGSTYSVLNGNPLRLNGLIWDTTVDPAPMHPNAGQTGGSTTVLKSPTQPSSTPYVNWSGTTWDAGTATQYHVLRNVVRPTQQLRE